VNTRHAVFVALGGGIGGIPPEKVVVKFTKRYNTAAHTKLAALGLAPKLYYHAAVRGGLFMVVMEKVVGSTAFRWLSLNGTTRLPLSVYTDVEAAVKELHEVDLVFGDLRLPNIMIRVEEQDGNGNGGKAQGGDVDTIPPNGQGSANTGSRSKADSDSGVRALLIDFDWVAKDGVGRYPATISTSQEFSPAVDPYGLMHKAHDLYCLDLLQKRCK
jgi:serine/threonine protein kinase